MSFQNYIQLLCKDCMLQCVICFKEFDGNDTDVFLTHQQITNHFGFRKIRKEL